MQIIHTKNIHNEFFRVSGGMNLKYGQEAPYQNSDNYQQMFQQYQEAEDR